jgi:DNA polymerase III subunit delta
MVLLHVIHGEEQLLCDEYARSLYPLDMEGVCKFDMRETSIQDIELEATQVSLFGPENKTIVLSDCYFLGTEKALPEKELDILSKLIADTQNQTTLIFRINKLDKRKKLVKELLKKAQVFEGSPIKYPQKWLKSRAEGYELKFNSSAVEKMIAFLGNDLYLLDSELKKVKNRYPNEAEITDTMLEDVLSKTLESNVFKLIDEALNGRVNAINILQDLLISGSNEIEILLLLARQLRIIEQVKIAYITKKPHSMSVAPFVIQIAQEQGDPYELEEIQNMLNSVIDLDLKMKRGQVDKTIALESLILSWM